MPGQKPPQWREDHQDLIRLFNRHREGGRPFFIAAGAIMLGVLYYLFLLP